VVTLVTTLGYGNFHPRTPQGQAFAVIFGLIGIPVMGYALSQVGRLVVEALDAHGAAKEEAGASSPPAGAREERTHRRIVVLCALNVSLILAGGILFQRLEGWGFLEACYFSTGTLMTIGFGDYLPTAWTSRLAAVVFIMLGMGVGATMIALLQVHIQILGDIFADVVDKSANGLKKMVGEYSTFACCDCVGAERRDPGVDGEAAIMEVEAEAAGGRPARRAPGASDG